MTKYLDDNNLLLAENVAKLLKNIEINNHIIK